MDKLEPVKVVCKRPTPTEISLYRMLHDTSGIEPLFSMHFKRKINPEVLVLPEEYDSL